MPKVKPKTALKVIKAEHQLLRKGVSENRVHQILTKSGKASPVRVKSRKLVASRKK